MIVNYLTTSFSAFPRRLELSAGNPNLFPLDDIPLLAPSECKHFSCYGVVRSKNTTIEASFPNLHGLEEPGRYN